MQRTRVWGYPVSLDWIGLTTRLLFLAALPLVAGYFEKLSSELITLLAGWVLFNLLFGLVRRWGWKPGWQEGVAAVIDVVFAVAAITLTGAASSPLWWSLLIGAARASLAYGMTGALSVTALGLVSTGVVSVAFAPEGFRSLIAIGMFAGVLVLPAILIGWLGGLIRREALSVETEQANYLTDMRERDRQRARAILHMAAELNTTLDCELVHDLALDLSSRALEESGVGDTRLVSALLLLVEEELRIVSARRLDHVDRRLALPGQGGVIGQALNVNLPLVCQDPVSDPELKRLAAMGECRTVLCVPLAAGAQIYGVMIFGYPEPGYFSLERVELLRAVARQAMSAIQNIRLFQDLQEEKELMTEIQEEVRKKLARDLHDGPTQTVAAIAMRVNFARRLMQRDPEMAATELTKVEYMARHTTQEIRNMLFTLRPLILESKGLVAAVTQLAEKMNDTHRLNVIVEAEPDVAKNLEIGKQGVVFYIAEEAINNARKHAEAAHIWVRLNQQSGLFVLEVQDDGVGFNVGAVDAHYEQRGSLGIVNMRERTELVNGTLQIKSAEGEGTRITVIVPVNGDGTEPITHQIM
jgi:signal transduction histidine kinase